MKIGIIGLGYVGLPLVIQFAKCGAQVVGFDVDETKITAFNSGESYIQHIPSRRMLVFITMPAPIIIISSSSSSQ